MMPKLRILLLLWLLMPCAATAAQLPPLTLPEGVGINIHFTRGHERDLDMIADAGIKVVRMDFKWAATERFKGVYDWSAYDDLTTNLLKRGLRPYYILDYSNPIYEGTTPKLKFNVWPYNELMSPQHPDSVAAFARWAAAAAAHFRKQAPIWEIWNEPNIHFWRPAPNVVQYTQLAEATCVAIRKAVPNATIIGPASSGFPWDFLKDFLAAGVLQCLDAVSVHPYRSKYVAPESVVSDYTRLRQMIDRYTPAQHKSVPIISGEWGYSTVISGTLPQDQADYLVRMQLINLHSGVPVSIMYDWINDGSNAYNNEFNFGIVDTDFQPKPAYQALRVMTHTLAGYHIARRLQTVSPWDYALLLANGAGQRIIAAWTANTPHEITLNILAANCTTLPIAIDGMGKPLILHREAGRIVLNLGSMPQYITLDPIAAH